MAGFRERRCWCLKLMWRWLWLGVALAASAAPNRVEEARLVEHLAEELRQGQTVEIPLGSEKFAAVYARSSTRTVRGAVVFLPEAGWRLDSPIAAELERYLPAHGWDVLSLQLPLLEPEAPAETYLELLEDAASRLKAALAWLKSQGGASVAAVGHGFGALALLKYLAEPEPELKAAVLLGFAWPKSEDDSIRTWLQAVPLPVLDVYAEQDHPQVQALATERHLLLKGKPGYRQLRFSASDHAYHAREALLARRIDGWLRRVVPGGNHNE